MGDNIHPRVGVFKSRRRFSPYTGSFLAKLCQTEGSVGVLRRRDGRLRIGRRGREGFDRFSGRLTRRPGRAGQPNLPAAAQRPVNLHQVGGHGPLRHGQLVLLLGQRLLDDQHPIEVGLAVVVLRADQFQRLFGGRGAFGQDISPACWAWRKPTSAFSTSALAWSTVFWYWTDQLLEAGVLDADVVHQPAVVRACSTGTTAPRCRPPIRPSKRSLKLLASKKIVPVIEKCGYRSGGGDADLALCAAAWRSARRTSGRRRSRSAGMPTATCGGADGNGPRRAEHLVDVPRRHAQQDANLVGRLAPRRLQRRDLASVCERFDWPWVTSSRVVAPLWNFSSARFRLSVGPRRSCGRIRAAARPCGRSMYCWATSDTSNTRTSS